MGKGLRVMGTGIFPLIFEGFFPQIAPISAGAIQKGQSKFAVSPCASAMFKTAVFLSPNKIKSRIIPVPCF